MNYYALFLDENNFIEKSILLMRFISNPSSKSLPHITVRLFKTLDSRIAELKERKFTHLNIIEPGTFNLDEEKPPYVVFLRCESEELEGIEYKPDFPYSRLHITIYEGNDLIYAKKLYQLMKEKRWHFKLLFNKPRQLTERKLGTKARGKIDFEEVYKKLLGNNYQDFLENKDNTKFKLNLIRKLLDNLGQYLNDAGVESIDSLTFCDINNGEDGGFEQYQLNFESLVVSKDITFKNTIRDAIYITPPEYARDMAQCGLAAFGEDNRKIDFGDSSVGTGTLFLALKYWVDEVNKWKNKSYEFQTAIGVDIDEDMVREAYARCKKRGLEVIYGDALSPKLSIRSQRNLMLVNPPFNRHEEIPNDYKAVISQLAKEQTGIDVLGNAGLYVYHLLIMDKWLCNDAVAVWLLPTIFMQTKYGEAIRKYLLINVQLIRIHVYSEKLEQFEDTQVSTSIVVFQKTNNLSDKEILFSYGDSVERPDNSRIVNRDMLFLALDNWRVFLNQSTAICAMQKQVTFGDLFDIRRGLATGANSFFVMTRERAKQYHIPDIALKPLIPKSRYLNSLIVEAREDGYPDVDPQLVLIDCDLNEGIIQERYPDFYEYLQQAKIKGKDGTAIVDRFLIRNRKLWYKQEKREPPTFLLTYMGRNKKELPPLYFIWNKSNGIALNTYLLLYPKERLEGRLNDNPQMYEKVLNALNESASMIITSQTRVYSGGLKKIEPRELSKLPIVGIDKFI